MNILNFNDTDENDILKMLDIYIDTNIKIYPHCNTDVSPQNIMMLNDSFVLIDWDDTLFGHTHTFMLLLNYTKNVSR